MKKSFLILLSSILAVFLITGCADDTTSNNGGSTGGGTGGITGEPLTEELMNQLKGTYDVKFFGSQVTNARGPIASMADYAYISNDCAEAQNLFPDIVNVGNKNKCVTSGTDANQVTLLEGKVTIDFVNNKMVIKSKMQMNGGAVELSASDKYQYTEYYEATTTAGTGVRGWNYDAANNQPSGPIEFANSPFKVTLNTDGTVCIEMTLKDKTVSAAVGLQGTVDAVNTVILHNKNTTVTALENKVTENLTTPAE